MTTLTDLPAPVARCAVCGSLRGTLSVLDLTFRWINPRWHPDQSRHQFTVDLCRACIDRMANGDLLAASIDQEEDDV